MSDKQRGNEKEKTSGKQYINCVKDTAHEFYDQVVALSGLEPEAIEQITASLGFPIYPNYDVRIEGDELWVGNLHHKLSDIRFIYDYAGVPETIRQELEAAGCYYHRKVFQIGWFNQERISPRRAIHVDLIRLCSGFNNLFFRSNIRGRIALILALQGLPVDEQLYRNCLATIGDAYLQGFHAKLIESCNLAEANAAKATWQLSNKLLAPYGFAVYNRISDRLYQLKRMLGNFRTMARSPGDALFNMMFILCEEELWKILEEKGIHYLGVGGFSHFSYYSDLVWMGLVLDLCEPLKFAGHAKLVQAIENGIVDNRCINPLRAFKNEQLYTLTPFGEETLYKLKEELFKEPSIHKGATIPSFRKACSQSIDEFDELLWRIGRRFDDDYLLLKQPKNPFPLPAKLWRLTLAWEQLQPADRAKVQVAAFTICQEEIQASKFEPLVWLPTKRIARRVDEAISGFEELTFLYEGWEQERLQGKEPKVGLLSPAVRAFAKRFEEIEITWIS